MSILIKYPSIGQFRNAIRTISDKIAFQGLDEDDSPIMDYNIPKPTLKFHGTVKLHGTNASVCFNLPISMSFS